MKKTLILCLAMYIAGILVFENSDTSAAVFVCIAVLLAAVFKCAVGGVRKNGAVLAVCVCFVFGTFYTSAVLSNLSYGLNELENQNVTVEGRIVEVGTQNDYYDNYRLRLIKVEKDGETLEHRAQTVKLSLKKYGVQNSAQYSYGDVIRVSGEAEKIDEPLNAGETDYAKIALSDGIMLEITAKSDKSVFLYNDISYFNIYDLAVLARTYFLGEIDRYFGGNEASLLKGMLLSEKAFDKDYYKQLSDSGMSHITVASGLHTGCVAALVMWLCFAFSLKKRRTYIITMTALWCFAFLQGMTASIVRAVIMMCLYMLAQLSSRDYDKLYTLVLTAFGMLIINPYMVYDVGFVLSFCSVLGIILFEPLIMRLMGHVKRFKKTASLIAVSLSAQILLIPLLALYFNKVSPYSLLANMLITPLVAPVLALGFAFLLLCALGGFAAYPVAAVISVLLKYMNMVIYAVSGLPFAVSDVFGMDFWRVTLYYLVIGALYLRAARADKRLSALCLTISGIICAVGIGAAVCDMQLMNVSFINVGQGDAALIQIPYGKTVVIDGGGSSAVSSTDIGEKIFVPYLRRKGINKIDYAILSHYDKDHAQGIAAAVRMMEVDNLILPYRAASADKPYKQIIEGLANEHGVNVMYFRQGDSLDINGAHFDVLSPSEELAEDTGTDENEKSLALKLTYGKTSLLFSGDIEESVEEKLTQYGDAISCDVLKVAHHGSKKSSNPKFIETSAPKYAIISAGRNNMYGFPKSEVVDTLLAEGAEIYITGDSGTVSLAVSENKIEKITTLYGRDDEKIYLKSGEGEWLRQLRAKD